MSAIPSRPLYAKHPILAEGFLPASDGHRLAFYQSGNPRGIPVVYLHGGPGAKTVERHRQYFDPAVYHIIQYDQRGGGNSTSEHGPLHANTTWHHVADVEAVRQQLGIDKWVVAGGSWGTTLGLAYAEKYPQHVSGMLLRGIWLARPEDIQATYSPAGLGDSFTEAWKQFAYPDVIHSGDPTLVRERLWKSLTSAVQSERFEASRRFEDWGTVLGLGSYEKAKQSGDLGGEVNEAHVVRRLIEVGYDRAGFYLANAQILDNIDPIRHIPSIIIQGASDYLCPQRMAIDLAAAWGKNSELRIIPNGPHFDNNPLIYEPLTAAADELATLIK